MSRRFLPFLAVAALAPAALHADAPVVTTREYLNYCTSGAFHTCASVRIQVISTPTGSALVLQVQNRQGNSYGYDNVGPTSISSFTLTGRPGLTHYFPMDSIPGLRWPITGVTTSGPVGSLGQSPGVWDPTLGMQVPGDGGDVMVSSWYLNTFGKGIFGCDALPIDPNAPEFEGTPQGFSGAYQTCTPAGQSGWVEFWMVVDIPSTAEDWELSWTMDGGGGFNGASGCSTGPESDCVTVTPRPVSLTLVATGLAGMALVRRRRRNDS
ncbi:MAG: VPLPA-CTERM sorting domain-containing protein [Gemmatimonadetes bacterium]|nr:VPLPA-CTERM sorting domain-containing protein [Gemmatimonadota bacterium]